VSANVFVWRIRRPSASARKSADPGPRISASAVRTPLLSTRQSSVVRSVSLMLTQTQSGLVYCRQNSAEMTHPRLTMGQSVSESRVKCVNKSGRVTFSTAAGPLHELGRNLDTTCVVEKQGGMKIMHVFVCGRRLF